MLEKANKIKEQKNKITGPPVPPPRAIDPNLMLEFRLRGAHRKPEAAIKAQSNMEFTPPTRKTSDYRNPIAESRQDKITQAQKLFEYRGQVPAELAGSEAAPALIPVGQSIRRTRAGSASRNSSRAQSPSLPPEITAAQQRFDELVQEVADREKFLADMASHGLSKQYEPQIKAEISQYVHEMKKLEKILQAS
eukprot:TRINITY_DN12555_c0_g1_i1.p1 TRINITY_DN12555_c0_g1~~TRINITY_DN12555_c0_g1_i1.p1  ORF type:complete len:193 (+),score=33.10 TRINITY_DN12555_c0_g1_i1:76-654(+)